MLTLFQISLLAALAIVNTLYAVPASAQTRSVWDGVYSEQQAQNGKLLYDANCSQCHGPALGGSGMAPALSHSEFIWKYDGLPVSVLYKRIIDTMPPGDSGSVNRSDKIDILAFILQENSFPDGNEDLPKIDAALSVITWRATEF